MHNTYEISYLLTVEKESFSIKEEIVAKCVEEVIKKLQNRYKKMLNGEEKFDLDIYFISIKGLKFNEIEIDEEILYKEI